MFLIPHVFKSLDDQEMVHPADVFCKMLLVVCGKAREIFSVREFAGKVKYSLEHIGK